MKVNLSSHWMVYRTFVAIALLVQLLLLNGSIVHPAVVDRNVVPSEESQAEIADLPQPLQYAISRDLGRDQPAYHFSTQPDGSYLANEPRSGLRARLQPSKLHVNAGEHSWSLGLSGWGRGEVLESLPAASSEQLDANRLSFSHGGLTEWYRNGPLGLQQGWTLMQPPGDLRDEPLALVFTQDGSLNGAVDERKDNLALADSAGVVHLRYGGLLAYDAQQQPLPAWFEVRGEKVVVRVEDAQATYPVTIDPWLQASKLTTSQADRLDELGSSVAISADGGTVVVSAPTYFDFDITGPGAVYIYTKTGDWVSTPLYTARLTDSDPIDMGALGTGVAVNAEGNLVVAGAPYKDVGGQSSGAAYLYVRPAGGWVDAVETAKLTASDGEEYNYLGESISINADGSLLAIGAPGADVGGDQRGAVYLFTRPDRGWQSTSEFDAKLTASDGEDYDEFGSRLALSADGGTLAVGRILNDNGGINRGAVYVYVRPVSGWEDATQTAKLTASDGEDQDFLGASVALSADGSTLAAGSNNSAGGDKRGALYVFVRPSGGWVNAIQTAKLTASDGQDNDHLGRSVSLSADGSILAAGSFNSAGGERLGAVYAYVRPDDGWVTTIETAKLTASDGLDWDQIGRSVALSADGNTLVAGAPRVSRGGAAYLYERPIGGWVTATEDAKLTAGDARDNDNLGRSVALSADGITVAAGAPYNDAGGEDRGAAYIYTRPSAGWPGSAVFSTKLTASDGQDKDFLGRSVALSSDGSTLAVGAPYHNLAGDNRGAVYVYERPPAGWTTDTESAKLVASDGEDNDFLGRSVALSADGGTLAAGAPYHNAGGDNRGAVYVFVRPLDGWATDTEDAKLTAKGSVDGDALGISVALSGTGEVLAAGAPWYDAGGEDRGAAYIFLRPENGWENTQQRALLTASDGGNDDRFGYAVSLNGGGYTLAVGAPDYPAGDLARGAIYVFERPTDGWVFSTETARLTASDGGDQDKLGFPVAIDSDGQTIIAGAYGNAAGGMSRGAVYLYARPENGWADTTAFDTKLTASDGLDNDSLGYWVAIDAAGDTLVAGAPNHDVVSDGSDRGAAYVFARLIAPAFTSGAPPTPATIGTAYAFIFTASGYPPPGFSLSAGSLPPGLTLDESSGLLSGIPSAAGSYTFTVSADNGVEPAASQVVTLNVETDQELIYLPLVISQVP